DVAALHPTTEGTRIRISGGKGIVTDGPFAETKEAIGGFWLINVNSKAEAIEWAKRAPHSCAAGEGWAIELPQLREREEFEAGGDEGCVASHTRQRRLTWEPKARRSRNSSRRRPRRPGPTSRG